MNLNVKIVSRLQNTGRLKGIATVCFDNQFLVTGVRIVDCETGYRVFMPSRKTEQGEYKDVCFPLTSDLYKKIKEEVLKEFQKESRE